MSKVLGERAGFVGELLCRLWGPDGKLKAFRHMKNLTVTEGFDSVIDTMFGAGTANHFDYIAIGDTATSLAEGDSALENEVDRQQGTYTHTNNTKMGTLKFQWGVGVGPWALKESSLNNDAGVGIMFCRGTYAVVNKGTADTFEQEWRYTLS